MLLACLSSPEPLREAVSQNLGGWWTCANPAREKTKYAHCCQRKAASQCLDWPGTPKGKTSRAPSHDGDPHISSKRVQHALLHRRNSTIWSVLDTWRARGKSEVLGPCQKRQVLRNGRPRSDPKPSLRPVLLEEHQDAPMIKKSAAEQIRCTKAANFAGRASCSF